MPTTLMANMPRCWCWLFLGLALRATASPITHWSLNRSHTCDSAFTSAINSVLHGAVDFIDSSIPKLTKDLGLDPLNNAVSKYTVDLPHNDGCSEICGAQLASCHHFRLHLTSADVVGLSGLTLDPIKLSDCNLLGPGDKCPYGRNMTGSVFQAADGLLSGSGGLGTQTLRINLDLISRIRKAQ